jgi:hypothetical protein
MIKGVGEFWTWACDSVLCDLFLILNFILETLCLENGNQAQKGGVLGGGGGFEGLGMELLKV